MARRVAKPSAPLPSGPASRSVAGQATCATERDEVDRGAEAARVGERFRRVALGLTAALVTARAFWPSEPDVREWENSGLAWVLVLLVVSGLALAASFVGGCFRFRWSWTDLAVVCLTAVVAASASHAMDRRPAINLAWEWLAVGLTYFLIRNLPRTRNESTAVLGALVATAFAVSVYGLYQAQVELPLLRAEYLRNPVSILQKLSIEPGGRGEEMLRNRLLFSNELLSTFVLANSLAGFILGPLVLTLAVSFQNLVRRDGRGARWPALVMAAPIILLLLVSLILTKSRSSWVGFMVAVSFLAWRARRRVSARGLWAAGVTGIGVVMALVLAGLATGRLDREVLTQSTMSLRYRWEYWQGTWGVITGGATSLLSGLAAPVFWSGVGPGNFSAPYLKYKLPQSSEEILDPHNMLLEVWATAGIWALFALVGALGCGLWNLLGPSRPRDDAIDTTQTRRTRHKDTRRAPSPGVLRVVDDNPDLDGAPDRVTWLVVSAGVGGWFLVVMLGQLNPFVGDLFYRWLVLGAAWLAAVLLGAPLWRRLPISATALGAAVLAVAVNLLAAGGIGIPTVALALWSMLALGLNLRDDRRCGRLYEYESRIPPFVIAVAWAALVGTFYGLIAPFWRSESLIAEAQTAMRHHPPEFDHADAAYRAAIEADRYYARPWRELAGLHFLVWRENGAKVDDIDSRWSLKTIPMLYQMAATPPRNPNAWGMHSERARMIHQLINLVGSKLEPLDLLRYRGEIVKSTRTASLLNPTSSELHARLANESAEISMFQDAVVEANEALRLDRLTPHRDKKLPPGIREHLESMVVIWGENAAKTPIGAKP